MNSEKFTNWDLFLTLDNEIIIRVHVLSLNMLREHWQNNDKEIY